MCQAEAPSVTASLEWIYGYRGKDSRANLYSLPTGEICYYVASLAVLYSPESQTQRHYRGHTEDIECLATHPQLSLCATGQGSSQHSPGEDTAHVQVRLSLGCSILLLHFYIIKHQPWRLSPVLNV